MTNDILYNQTVKQLKTLGLLGMAREPLPECHPPDAAWSRPGSAFLNASHGGSRPPRPPCHGSAGGATDLSRGPWFTAETPRGSRSTLGERSAGDSGDAHVQRCPKVSKVSKVSY